MDEDTGLEITKTPTKEKNPIKVVNQVANRAKLIDILKHKLSGMSDREIGEIYGVTSQAINKRLQGVFRLLDLDKIEAYRANKINILTAMERELLDIMLQPDKLKKATFGNLAYGFTQLHTANRLESGQSTQVIDIGSELQALAQGRQALIDRLAHLESAEAIIIDDKEGDNNERP